MSPANLSSMSPRALALIASLAILTASVAAQAQSAGAAPGASAESVARVRRARRDRWGMTFAWGGSLGVAGPLGLAGTFVEFRPFRYMGFNAGVGGGGSFGPAVGGWVSVDPLSFRTWSLGVVGNASMNISIIRGTPVTGRAELPNVTAWLGVGAQVQFRPSRSTFVRLSGGYQWLLDVQRFRVASDSELTAAGLPSFFFQTPFDAMRAAARNESYGLPYVSIELGTYWRL
ncbi:MAG: hypothetical protein U0269_35030 [Polyangiales bacterium]